jgi:hypothetical protein
LAQSLLRIHAFEWWTAQKDVKPKLMGSLPHNAFKAKLNERFTPHNQILKDGQELLNLRQSNGLGAIGRYVQTFVSLFNLIPMKKKYA